MRSGRRTGWLGLAGVPAGLLLVTAFYLPLLSIGIRSITADASLSLGFANLSAASFVRLAEDTIVRRVVANTLEISLFSTLASIAVAYPLCIALRGLRPAARATVLALVTMTLWTSILVRLYAWTIILGRRGILNSIFIGTGLTDQPVDLLFNTTSVVIGMTNFLIPYAMLIMYPSIMGVDEDLLSAGRSLGAREVKVFARIFLPMTAPVLVAAFIVCLALSLGYYITPAVLGGPSDITVPVFIQQRARLFDWGSVSALGVSLLFVTLALTALATRLLPLERIFGGR
jgi:ABC-type spermidine/putrescine transport system permease subunit I